jgi:putative iron-regulated protein
VNVRDLIEMRRLSITKTQEVPVTRLALIISFALLCACSPKEKIAAPSNENTPEKIDTSAFTAQVGIVAYTSLSDATQAAQSFDSKLASFMYHPNPVNHTEIQVAWRVAYDRFLNSLIFSYLPIQDPPDWYSQKIDYKQLLMQLDSWPIEGGYIDYIKGYPYSGIVNDLTLEINEDSIRAQHGFTDPTNASLGYHAIEFMLWGHTGKRQSPDFFPQDNTAPIPSNDSDTVTEIAESEVIAAEVNQAFKPQNHNRRRQYTQLLSELLQKDLHRIQRRWEPSSGYYAQLLQQSTDEDILQAAFIAAQELIKIELLEKRFSLMSSEFSQSSHQDLIALIAAIGQWFMPAESELQEASLFFLMQQSDVSIAEDFADSLQQSNACIGRMSIAASDKAAANLDQCKQDVITLLSNLTRAAGSLQVDLPNLD